MVWTTGWPIFVLLLLRRTPGILVLGRIVLAIKAFGLLRTRAGFVLPYFTTAGVSILAISIHPSPPLKLMTRLQKDTMEILQY
jgi:hypothetical protein